MYDVISLICKILKNNTNVDFYFHGHNIVSFSFKAGYQVSVSTSRCTAFLSINGNYCQITTEEHSAIWVRGTPREVACEGIPASPEGDAEVRWYIVSCLGTPKLMRCPVGIRAAVWPSTHPTVNAGNYWGIKADLSWYTEPLYSDLCLI